MGVRLEPGETLLGRFALVQELGGEGRTRLWLAEDRSLGESVALRVLDPGLSLSEGDLEQLRQGMREVCREARRLAHPHILRVYDIHADREICLISREYVTGIDLSTLADRPHTEILQALLPIVEALEYAHDNGVVHGDLKQSKIVGGRAEGWRLADFGLDYALRPAGERETPLSPRDDVIALGVLLGELIGGPVLGMEDHLASRLREVQRRMVDPAHVDSLQSMHAVRGALVPLASSTRATNTAPQGTDDPRDNFESIKPVPFRVVSSGAAGTDREVPHRGGSGWGRWTLATFGLLVAISLGVFFYLPHWVESRRGQAEGPSGDESAAQGRVEEDEEVPTEQGAATAVLSDETKRFLVDVMTAYDGLRARGAELWGGLDFDRAKVLRLQAENALQTRDTARATPLLRESLEILVSLERQQPQILATALAQGEAALAEGLQEEAETQFALALRIDPANAAALKGAERARRLNEVLALTRVGADAERMRKLSEARKAYAQALEIDPLWTPATEALARVDAELADETYKVQMARAVRAVSKDELSEARTAYQAALEVRPESTEARVGLAHVERVRRSRGIEHHRRQAETAERSENWGRAAEHYRAVLDLDKEVAFAKVGLERSRKREHLMKRMTYLIDHPRDLYDPTTLSEARGLVAAVGELQTKSPGLEQQRARLSDLITQASTPIPVVLESDNQTEVTIKRVGRLGTFTRREVLLQPGTYVVLGIRRGYRDVRRTITVAPGEIPPKVRVSCSEEITSFLSHRGVST